MTLARVAQTGIILIIYAYWERRVVLAWLRHFPDGWWDYDTPTSKVRSAVFELAILQAACTASAAVFLILVGLLSAEQ